MSNKNEKTVEKPSQSVSMLGQSAPEISLPYGELSNNQRKVVDALRPVNGKRPVLGLIALAEDCFPHVKASPDKHGESVSGKDRANSRVRNAMRYLVPGGWTENFGEKRSGEYRLTEKALDRLRRISAEKVGEPVAKRLPRAKTAPPFAVVEAETVAETATTVEAAEAHTEAAVVIQ